MPVPRRKCYDDKLENTSIQDACRLLQRCNAALCETCGDIEQYVEAGPGVETNVVLLPPAYLELLRRRGNLVATIVSIAAHLGRHVEGDLTN